MVASIVAAVLSPIVKDLASKGLSILSGAVVAKGKDVIEEKLGVDLESAMATEEGVYKLKALEFEHEEFLIQATLDEQQAQLDQDRLHAEDRQSAREMQVAALAQDDPVIKYFTPGLAVAGLVGIFAYFGAITFLEFPERNRDLAMMFAGACIAAAKQIFDFFFGSSAGSKAKQTVLESTWRKG